MNESIHLEYPCNTNMRLWSQRVHCLVANFRKLLKSWCIHLHPFNVSRYVGLIELSIKGTLNLYIFICGYKNDIQTCMHYTHTQTHTHYISTHYICDITRYSYLHFFVSTMHSQSYYKTTTKLSYFSRGNSDANMFNLQMTSAACGSCGR